MDVLNEQEAAVMAEIAMLGCDVTKRNFEIRQELVDYAVVHRCNGENPPVLSS